MEARRLTRRRVEPEAPTVVPMPVARREERRELEEDFRDLIREWRTLVSEAQATQLSPVPDMSIIEGDLRRLEQELNRIDIDQPALGAGYQSIHQFISENLAIAGLALASGSIGTAVTTVHQMGQYLARMGAAHDAQTGIMSSEELVGDLPRDMSSAETTDALIEAAFTAITDSNELRARNTLGALGHLVENLGTTYNTPVTVEERNEVIEFVHVLHDSARRGEEYTVEMAHEDARTIRGFRARVAGLRRQTVDHYITQVRDSRTELLALIEAEEARGGSVVHLVTLRRDMDALLGRLRREQQGRLGRDQQAVTYAEIRNIERRNDLVNGRQPQLTTEELIERLQARATRMRGDVRRPAEGSQEWFAQQALNALGHRYVDIASVSLAAGEMARAAEEANMDLEHEFPNYHNLLAVLAGRMVTTSGELSRYASVIREITAEARAARLTARYSRGGRGAAHRRRIAQGAEVAADRISDGDYESAESLLGMLERYERGNERHGWRGTWAGQDAMGMAIDAAMGIGEIEEHPVELFTRGASQEQIDERLARARTGVGRWRGASFREPREILQAGFARVEELGGRDSRDAGEFATMLLMYYDSIDMLRGGRGPLSEDDAGLIRGMGEIVTTLSSGRLRGPTESQINTFMEAYNGANRGFVEREANRLLELSERFPEGQEYIQAALRTALELAERGEVRGANIVRYVSFFYGEASTRREEGEVVRQTFGWRYRRCFAREVAHIPGYRQGGEEMIDGIRMMAAATTEQELNAAVRHFERGSVRIDTIETCMRNYRSVMGETALFQGVPAGVVPVGEREDDGSFPNSLRLEDVVAYDENLIRTSPELAADLASTHGRATLRQLRENMRTAAMAGNETEYERLHDLFVDRLFEVSNLVVSAQTRGRMVEQLEALELQRFRRLVGRFYAIPSGITVSPRLNEALGGMNRRLMEVEGRRQRMYAELTGGGTVNPEDFMRLLGEYSNEHRTARQFAFYMQQSVRGGGYNTLSRDFGGPLTAQAGVIAEGARGALDNSATHLEDAMVAVLGGQEGFEESVIAYREAMYDRGLSMGFLDAESMSGFTSASGSELAEGLTNFGTFLRGLFTVGYDEAVRRYGGEVPSTVQAYAGYVEAQESIARGMLFGTGTEADAERLEASADALLLLERSIFETPAAAMVGSDDFGHVELFQRRIGQFVESTLEQVEAGDLSAAEDSVDQARRAMEQMGAYGQSLQTASRMSTIAIGTALSLAGIFTGGTLSMVGGAIFVADAYAAYAREMAVTGEASTMTTVMLAAMVGTFGLGYAGSLFRALAVEYEGAAIALQSVRMLRLAAGFGVASRLVMVAGIGAAGGFSAVALAEARQAREEGRTLDEYTAYAMAVMPFALMAGHTGHEIYTGVRTRILAHRAQLQIRNPRGLYRFLRNAMRAERNAGRYTIPEDEVRAYAEERGISEEAARVDLAAERASREYMLRHEVSPEMRAELREMLRDPVVRDLLSRESPPAAHDGWAALNRFIESLEPLPTRGPEGPPSGPRGGGARFMADLTELFRLEGEGDLRSFLRDLNLPEGSTGEQGRRRGAAHETLDRLRQASEDPNIPAEARESLRIIVRQLESVVSDPAYGALRGGLRMLERTRAMQGFDYMLSGRQLSQFNNVETNITNQLADIRPVGPEVVTEAGVQYQIVQSMPTASGETIPIYIRVQGEGAAPTVVTPAGAVRPYIVPYAAPHERERIRAMAEGERPGAPPEVEVTPAAPAAPAVPVVEPRAPARSLPGRALEWVIGEEAMQSLDSRRASRRERRQALRDARRAPSIDDVMAELGEQLELILASATDPTTLGIRVRALRQRARLLFERIEQLRQGAESLDEMAAYPREVETAEMLARHEEAAQGHATRAREFIEEAELHARDAQELEAQAEALRREGGDSNEIALLDATARSAREMEAAARRNAQTELDLVATLRRVIRTGEDLLEIETRAREMRAEADQLQEQHELDMSLVGQAPGRVRAMMRSIYRMATDRATPRELRLTCWRFLFRIYGRYFSETPQATFESARAEYQRLAGERAGGNERVTEEMVDTARRDMERAERNLQEQQMAREELERIAETDSEFANILIRIPRELRTTAANETRSRGRTVTVEGYLTELGPRPEPGELEAIVRATATEAANRHAAAVDLLRARTAVERGESGANRRLERAQERFRELMGDMEITNEELQTLISEYSSNPLADIENLFGMRFDIGERAPLLLNLHHHNLIPLETVLSEANIWAGRSSDIVDQAPAGERLTRLIRGRLATRVQEGGSLDQMLIDELGLRSPQLREAVRAIYGERAMTLMQELARQELAAGAEANFDRYFQRLQRGLEYIDTLERLPTNGDPVVEALRNSLLDAVQRGGDLVLDEHILAALQSQDVIHAIRESPGPVVRSGRVPAGDLSGAPAVSRLRSLLTPPGEGTLELGNVVDQLTGEVRLYLDRLRGTAPEMPAMERLPAGRSSTTDLIGPLREFVSALRTIPSEGTSLPELMSARGVIRGRPGRMEAVDRTGARAESLADEAAETIPEQAGRGIVNAWRWLAGHEFFVRWWVPGVEYGRRVRAGAPRVRAEVGGRREVIPGTRGRRAISPRNLVTLLAPAAAWYFLAARPILSWIWNSYIWDSDLADDIEEMRRQIRQDHGVWISDENAQWAMSAEGGRFYRHFNAREYPTEERLVRPRTEAELQDLIESRERDFIANPAFIDELISDGRQMTGELPLLNALLARRSARSAAERTAAGRRIRAALAARGMEGEALEAEIGRIREDLDGYLSAQLGRMNITLEAVDAHLEEAVTQELAIYDMIDLRERDWRHRGVVISRLDIAARLFVESAGVGFEIDLDDRQLTELNNLMHARADPNRRARAETTLRTRLQEWDLEERGLTLEALDEFMRVRRLRFATVDVTDALLTGALRRRMERTLTGNPDLFMYMWSRVQEGSIPGTRIGDALANLLEPVEGTPFITTVAREAPTGDSETASRRRSRHYDTNLTPRLRDAEILITTPMPYQSFLSYIDELTASPMEGATDEEERTRYVQARRAYLALLDRFTVGPDASEADRTRAAEGVRALNEFVIQEGYNIIGEPAAVANLIIRIDGLRRALAATVPSDATDDARTRIESARAEARTALIGMGMLEEAEGAQPIGTWDYLTRVDIRFAPTTLQAIDPSLFRTDTTTLTRDDLDALGVVNPAAVDLAEINRLLARTRSDDADERQRAERELARLLPEEIGDTPQRRLERVLRRLNPQPLVAFAIEHSSTADANIGVLGWIRHHEEVLLRRRGRPQARPDVGPRHIRNLWAILEFISRERSPIEGREPGEIFRPERTGTREAERPAEGERRRRRERVTLPPEGDLVDRHEEFEEQGWLRLRPSGEEEGWFAGMGGAMATAGGWVWRRVRPVTRETRFPEPPTAEEEAYPREVEALMQRRPVRVEAWGGARGPRPGEAAFGTEITAEEAFPEGLRTFVDRAMRPAEGEEVAGYLLRDDATVREAVSGERRIMSEQELYQLVYHQLYLWCQQVWRRPTNAAERNLARSRRTRLQRMGITVQPRREGQPMSVTVAEERTDAMDTAFGDFVRHIITYARDGTSINLDQLRARGILGAAPETETEGGEE